MLNKNRNHSDIRKDFILVQFEQNCCDAVLEFYLRMSSCWNSAMAECVTLGSDVNRSVCKVKVPCPSWSIGGCSSPLLRPLSP